MKKYLILIFALFFCADIYAQDYKTSCQLYKLPLIPCEACFPEKPTFKSKIHELKGISTPIEEKSYHADETDDEVIQITTYAIKAYSPLDSLKKPSDEKKINESYNKIIRELVTKLGLEELKEKEMVWQGQTIREYRGNAEDYAYFIIRPIIHKKILYFFIVVAEDNYATKEQVNKFFSSVKFLE